MSSTTSFDEFFRAHHDALFAAMCLATGSRQEADDITQEAFVRLLERWDRVDTIDDPKGYLFRTAMNVFRQRLRRAAVASRVHLSGRPRDDAFATIDDRDAVVRALKDLTPRQRAAVVMTTILDLSSDEAGQMLGISGSTVRVLALRAREAVREQVEEDA